jgi:hypothetical protein
VVAQVVRRYEGKVAFVGIGSRDGRARLEEFVDRHDLATFPHAADESGDLRGRLGVFGQPTWIFIAADGSSEKVFGGLGEVGLTDRLDELVG